MQASPQAANAVAQLMHVSQQLSDYHTDLSNQIDDTVALNEVQAEMLGLPFDDSSRNQQDTTKLELGKRAATTKAMTFSPALMPCSPPPTRRKTLEMRLELWLINVS